MKYVMNLLFASLFCFTAIASDEVRFVENMTWTQIKAKALKEHKMIFFDAFASWCGPCKYMENSVYTEKKVADYFNSSFINVKIDMEKGEGVDLAEEFEIGAYPTFLFFSPEGKLVHKYVGAMEADEFLSLGNDATDPGKQYFTLKTKAQNLALTDAEFAAWAAMAYKLEDPDKRKILAVYLAAKKDILDNKNTANVAILYADSLTDAQLTYLYKQQARISGLLGWNAAETAATLYDKLFDHAINIYERSQKNINSFEAVIRKYDPSKLNYAVKDLRFLEAVKIEEDNNKATTLLVQYLNDVQKPVSIEDIGNWIFDNTSFFTKEDLKKINTQLASFKLRPIDKGKEYWLYLIQMFCWLKAGDEAKAKSFAEKAYHHPGLPKAYKDILKDSYSFSD